MPNHSEDLHGSAPDKNPIALLLVDVINPLDFPEADQFLIHALPAAKRIAELKRQAVEEGVPVIYANDNFGRWRSDLNAVVESCLENGCKGSPLVKLLHPGPEDYFVLKPKHSAFYSTVLNTLLLYLGTETLVIAGFAGNICVLFTANDAYMRDYRVIVPSDCTASNTVDENNSVLEEMRRVLKCETTPSTSLQLKSLSKG